MTEKFRADQIGSLLAARRGHDAGAVTDAGLREAEDQAITAAVGRQEATGAEIAALIPDGVRYIQLDNRSLALSDSEHRPAGLVADVARSVWGHEGPND